MIFAGDDDWWCPVICDEATAKTCGTGDFAECVALTAARPRGSGVTMGWETFRWPEIMELSNQNICIYIYIYI